VAGKGILRLMANDKLKAMGLTVVCLLMALISIRILVKNPGAKHEECIWACPKHIRSVCGSNGKTYLNKCIFELDNCKKSGVLTFQDGDC